MHEWGWSREGGVDRKKNPLYRTFTDTVQSWSWNEKRLSQIKSTFLVATFSKATETFKRK